MAKNEAATGNRPKGASGGRGSTGSVAIVDCSLCEHGYPPDEQGEVASSVLQRGDLLSEYWASAS